MKELRKQAGFSLVETLTAMIILTMVSSVVGIGVNTALKTYRDLTFSSESDLLTSTVNIALADLLHYAAYEEEASNDTGKVIFTNEDYYKAKKGQLFYSEGRLFLDKGNTDDPAVPGELLNLVNEGVYTSMNITYFDIHYNEGIFYGKYTVEDKTSKHVKHETFAYRTLKAKRSTTP